MYGLMVEDLEKFKEMTGVSIWDYAKEHGLRVEYGDPNSLTRARYLGLVFSGDFEHSEESDFRDDETKTEFKQRVRDALPKNAPEKYIGMWTESYYDG